MDSGQGAMMADRGGGSGGNAGGSVGIGNYKGVMLCNRPFGGLAAAARVQESSGPGGKGPFRCGCISDEVGIKVTKDPKSVRRPKKVTALSRHRKWLSELQKTKDELEAKYLEDLGAKQDKRNKFGQHEAKMRQQIRKMKRESRAAAAAAGSEEHAPAESKEEARPETNDEPATPSKQQQHHHHRHHHHHHRRPKWSMTEGEADQAEALDQDEEAQDLVDFAKSLDFEKYIGDMEVKTMMEQVVKRIHELEVSQAKHEAREKERADFKKSLRITSAPLSNQTEEDDDGYTVGSDDEEEVDEEDEVLAMAKGILRNRHVQRIHSARSAAAVVSKSMEKGLPPVSEEDAAAKDTEPKLAPPKIVRIEEDDGARIHGKKTPSQLPYLNRNPAI